MTTPLATPWGAQKREREVSEVVRLILRNAFVWKSGTLTVNSATPSAKNIELAVCANTSPTTITNFTDGTNNQELTVLLDANTTVEHNTSIKLSGGVNYVGSANDTLTLIRVSSVWYEKSRSVNG